MAANHKKPTMSELVNAAEKALREKDYPALVKVTASILASPHGPPYRGAVLVTLGEHLAMNGFPTIGVEALSAVRLCTRSPITRGQAATLLNRYADAQDTPRERYFAFQDAYYHTYAGGVESEKAVTGMFKEAPRFDDAEIRAEVFQSLAMISPGRKEEALEGMRKSAIQISDATTRMRMLREVVGLSNDNMMVKQQTLLDITLYAGRMPHPENRVEAYHYAFHRAAGERVLNPRPIRRSVLEGLLAHITGLAKADARLASFGRTMKMAEGYDIQNEFVDALIKEIKDLPQRADRLRHLEKAAGNKSSPFYLREQAVEALLLEGTRAAHSPDRLKAFEIAALHAPSHLQDETAHAFLREIRTISKVEDRVAYLDRATRKATGNLCAPLVKEILMQTGELPPARRIMALHRAAQHALKTNPTMRGRVSSYVADAEMLLPYSCDKRVARLRHAARAQPA
jgi:hypothetical protein